MNYSTLITREIDVLIAERVCGESMPPPPSDTEGELAQIGSGRYSDKRNWQAVSYYNESDIPRWEALQFSTDRNACYQALLKLETLGKPARLFMVEAMKMADLAAGWENGQYSGNQHDFWDLLMLTPRQLCEAMLIAVAQKAPL
jgi:hypothetical protein